MRRLERHARSIGLIGPFSPWWLVRYYLYRYGHGGAYLLLGVGCFLALLAVVHLQSDQGDTNRALTSLIKNIQVDRRVATSELCRSNNKLVLRLRGLIVNGAKSSRPFEKLYRAYGQPPYAERVKQAEGQAASLAVVPCAVLIERIRSQTPPPPAVP
jgi:hypothetical protein